MPTRDEELEQFKTLINLSEYAAGLGYLLDPKSSSRNSAVMRNDEGDKIVIARSASDHHWTYFSVRDHQDNGSIIDFVQRREGKNLGGKNLGQIRQVLRQWVPGAATLRPKVGTYVQHLEPMHRDLGAVRAVWEAMETIPFGETPYLNDSRGLPRELLSLGMLQDRIRVDPRGNVCFPHFNREGICGFEIKNEGFTGFSKHGTKGLWGTRPTALDTRLVIAETAIDALSYAAIRGPVRSRLVSIGGSMNPEQPELIASAIRKLPEGEVIIATDNDLGGDGIAQAIEQEFQSVGRSDVKLVEDRPGVRGQDWNQALTAASEPPAPGMEP